MMTPQHMILTGLLAAAEVAILLRAILRPHRDSASRAAWVVVIILLPLVGIILYLLVGEARISSSRRELGRKIDSGLPRPGAEDPNALDLLDLHAAPFALGRSVNCLGTTGGNAAHLAADSNAAIEEIVRDIDEAKKCVHLSAYIWLADSNGCKVKDALIRATSRGVTVRALADALGSRKFIGSSHWRDLTAAGAQMRVALPVGNPLWTLVRGRVDLRNHRKLCVIDNHIAWVGSQNVADPEFRIKPHYAPWVDIMTRWRGPVARHCQYLFVSDWMGEGGDDLSELLSDHCQERSEEPGEIIAQVIGTGPTIRYDSMPACFAELIHSARRDLLITTPYFVPDEQVLYALTSAARRGVDTTLLLPKHNDSLVVAATCRSYYRDLVASGVKLFEYHCGLLHAKIMLVDDEVGLIGSANLDRRSFELNFENNILFADPAFAAVIRARISDYLEDCDPVTPATIHHFGLVARLWQNSVAMVSPIL